MCDDWEQFEEDTENNNEEEKEESSYRLNFDFLSLLLSQKDYYSILEVGYDATEDTIRSNYIRLALKWHPDKQKDHDCATSRFQEINEAYQDDMVLVEKTTAVLSNPVKKREYDKKGMMRMFDYNIVDYLNRHKGLILTCNGLGIKQSLW